jgi:hypothetical protein
MSQKSSVIQIANLVPWVLTPDSCDPFNPAPRQRIIGVLTRKFRQST